MKRPPKSDAVPAPAPEKTPVPLPWMPFYPADWLSDRLIVLMTPEERGAVIQLLAHAWCAAESDCSLPDDDEQLRLLAGCSRAQWRRVSGKVREFFPKSSQSTIKVVDSCFSISRLRNVRQWELWQEAQAIAAQRISAAKAGAKARWGNRK